MAKTLLTMEVNKTDGGYGGMSVLTADGETARTVGYAIGTAIKRANNLAEQVIDQMKDDPNAARQFVEGLMVGMTHEPDSVRSATHFKMAKLARDI